jgi:hypothetical protein
MADIEFVDGLIVKAPHEKAPDFVKASISIKVEDLGVWLRAKHKAGEEWVNVDVKVAKSGKWYAAVNTYKKEDAKGTGGSPQPQRSNGQKKADPMDMEDDIPFATCDLSADPIFRKLRW